MLVKFQDRIYGKKDSTLLVWDSTWDTFRPVEKIVWNPVRKQVEPFYGQLCTELFDMNYGFGELKDMAVEFTDIYVSKLEEATEMMDPTQFWTWTGQETEWFYDRPIVLHPCTKGKPSRAEFLRILNLRARTAKRLPRQTKGTIKRRFF
jgi:hypothetical protein